MMRSSVRALSPLGVMLASCAVPRVQRAPAPQRRPRPVPVVTSSPPAAADAADPMAAPPPAGPEVGLQFPPVVSEALHNGLRVSIVRRPHLPLVRIAVILKSGRAEDGRWPGAAVLTGKLLARGGAGHWGVWQWADRVAALGTEMEAFSTLDTVRLSLTVTRDRWHAALKMLAAAVIRPGFSQAEFLKARSRAAEHAESKADDSTLLSQRALFRDIYQLPIAPHPYAHYSPGADELRHLTLTDCRRWYRAHALPDNALVVVVGDVKTDPAERAVARVFGAWKGKPSSEPSFTAPMPPDRTHVLLVDRPNGTESEIRMATLAPGPKGQDWPALELAAQIVADTAEPTGRRYSNGVVESFALAHPPVPLIVRVHSASARTARTVDRLLSALRSLGRSGPTEAELDAAIRTIRGRFAVRLGSLRVVSELAATLNLLGLPSDDYDRFNAALDDVTPSAVRTAVRAHFRPGHLVIVVVGDAHRIAESLTHFGPVSVIEPARSLSVARVLAADPTAPLAP